MSKVKDLLSLSPDQLSSLSLNELRTSVQTLASAANKRLKRLSASEIGRESPAYKSAMKRAYTTESGGKFGTKNKTINQLRNEYTAIRNFMTAKTGSLTGWNRYRQNIYDRIGGDFKGNATKERMFWKTFREINDESIIINYMGYGSKELQADLKQIMDNENPAEILREVNAMNVSPRRRNREEYIDKLSESGYILNENHRRIKIDLNDQDDVKLLLGLRIQAAYEEEQRNTADQYDPTKFFEV